MPDDNLLYKLVQVITTTKAAYVSFSLGYFSTLDVNHTFEKFDTNLK